MKTPYGLQVIETCLLCPLLKDHLFCDLPPRVIQALDAISSTATYPKGAVLFVEGQQPRGVFVICNGRVKLSATSVEGKSLILRIADRGEVVGLPGTMSGKAYEATAEAIEPIQANLILRSDFLQFLTEHGEAAVRIAEILSNIVHATYQELRYLGLSGSAAEKLARFLLDLIEDAPSRGGDLWPRVTLTLTHEEIAETVGLSRDTVTRLLGDFKRKRLIEMRGSTLIISNKTALERILGAN